MCAETFKMYDPNDIYWKKLTTWSKAKSISKGKNEGILIIRVKKKCTEKIFVLQKTNLTLWEPWKLK